MHSDLYCTAVRDATWKYVLGTNRSRGQQSFGFRVEQNEDSSSPGVLHEPRIPRLEGPKPLLSNSDRMLQPSADLRMQDVRLSANSNLKRKLAGVTLRKIPFRRHCCSLSAHETLIPESDIRSRLVIMQEAPVGFLLLPHGPFTARLLSSGDSAENQADEDSLYQSTDLTALPRGKYIHVDG